MLCLGFLRPGPPVSISNVYVPGLENVEADALSRPFSVLSPTAPALVSLSRVDMVQDPGSIPFRDFLPGSAPSLLSPLHLPLMHL